MNPLQILAGGLSALPTPALLLPAVAAVLAGLAHGGWLRARLLPHTALALLGAYAVLSVSLSVSGGTMVAGLWLLLALLGPLSWRILAGRSGQSDVDKGSAILLGLLLGFALALSRADHLGAILSLLRPSTAPQGSGAGPFLLALYHGGSGAALALLFVLASAVARARARMRWWGALGLFLVGMAQLVGLWDRAEGWLLLRWPDLPLG